MALKDLTIKGSILAEKQVEELVSKYVRYDVEEKQIHFLPAFTPLKNGHKVLVYLVALNGWPFLTKEPVPLEASPATISEAINVEGGSLRHTLMELKTSHLISTTGRLYRVHSAALGQIKDILQGTVVADKVNKSKSRAKKSKGLQEAKKVAKGNGAKKKNQRDLMPIFNKFITDGFFDQPRIIGDVKNRFAEKGLTVPLSSIPKMLLKATKDEKIARKKKEINKRKVWVYQRKK
jgi:hypothetical protein